jgi:uncharacterized RDD family membrane protein YckC
LRSRLIASLNGAWRGVKFGALAGIVIWLVITAVCLVFTLAIPQLREKALADLNKDRWPVLSAIGSICATFALMATYGALAGAAVMGLSSFVRAGKTPHAARDQDASITG